MSTIHVTTWLRAFFALQASAMQGRGTVEITSDDDEEAARWPRTTGDDILAIVAVLAPVVGPAITRTRSARLDRHWRTLLGELPDALADGPEQYRSNRAAWNALAALCLELYAVDASLPAEPSWVGLVEILGAAARRNGAPTATPFQRAADVKTYDALYRAQFTYLRDQRGTDDLDPDPGTHDRNRPIPRLTNADAIALADYWDKAFHGPVELGPAEVTLGPKRAFADAAWTRAYHDVQAVRTADPEGLYEHRNALWRAIDGVATYLAVAATAPSHEDLLVSALGVGIRKLPENLGKGAAAVAEAVAQFASDVATGAGKGFFSGFRGPLLVGAGLVGLYFLARPRQDKDVPS